MQSPLASGDDLAAQILGAREAEGRVANFILRLLLRLLQWEVSSRETCQSLWKLDFLLFAKYGKERQREYRELHLYGKALPLCNVPEAARQGIFRSSPRRVFSVWPYCWSCKKDHSQWIGYCSSGMHSVLAFCAGVCKSLAEDGFSGASGAN